VAAGVKGIEPKQAWTDVARLAAHGVPAVNFGPGATAQAHQRREWVELAALERCYAALARFLES
jgi:succinyl-diaminopimelate desuccinylase